MPRMKKPAPPKNDPWQATLTIEAYARSSGLKPRQVRRLLGSGRLPFMQVRGQIRIPRGAQVAEPGESQLPGEMG